MKGSINICSASNPFNRAGLFLHKVFQSYLIPYQFIQTFLTTHIYIIYIIFFLGAFLNPWKLWDKVVYHHLRDQLKLIMERRQLMLLRKTQFPVFILRLFTDLAQLAQIAVQTFTELTWILKPNCF